MLSFSPTRMCVCVFTWQNYQMSVDQTHPRVLGKLISISWSFWHNCAFFCWLRPAFFMCAKVLTAGNYLFGIPGWSLAKAWGENGGGYWLSDPLQTPPLLFFSHPSFPCLLLFPPQLPPIPPSPPLTPCFSWHPALIWTSKNTPFILISRLRYKTRDRDQLLISTSGGKLRASWDHGPTLLDRSDSAFSEMTQKTALFSSTEVALNWPSRATEGGSISVVFLLHKTTCFLSFYLLQVD